MGQKKEAEPETVFAELAPWGGGGPGVKWPVIKQEEKTMEERLGEIEEELEELQCIMHDLEGERDSLEDRHAELEMQLQQVQELIDDNEAELNTYCDDMNGLRSERAQLIEMMED